MDWQISGITDHTFASAQTVTLTQVGTWGAFNAYCLRPEYSPYTCTVIRFYDSGLGKYSLSLSCDHSYSKAWLSN